MQHHCVQPPHNTITLSLLVAIALSAQSVHAAPDFPSVGTVQRLVRDYVYSQVTLDPDEHKKLESIYYFDNQTDRTRYERSMINAIPIPEGAPRFLGPDGIPFPHDHELFRPEDVLVVPAPEGITDDAEPMAIVFYPDWMSENYKGPGVFRFVRADGQWLIHFETYLPTSYEDRQNGNTYMLLKEISVREKRTRWANATGDDLDSLSREFLNRSRFELAAGAFAIAHDIHVAQGVPFMTNERLQKSKVLFNDILKMSPEALRTMVLQDFDNSLARYAENAKKLEQAREYVKQQDLKRQQER